MAPDPRGLPIAFAWLTVAPIPARLSATVPDRALGGSVITAVPVVGMALGALAAVLAWGLAHTALPALLIGVAVVAALALATRGMHIDGLADTADGLGCYGPPERVAEVMRSGSAGPFGMITLIIVAAAEIVGFSALAESRRWLEIALAVLAGRLAAVIACRGSMRPAHPDGFGALVVGTQRRAWALWTLATLAIGVIVGGFTSSTSLLGTEFDLGHALRAAIAVLVVGGVTLAFTRHCARRMGGISGDVLGAVIELGTAITLVILLC